ncbi:MAG: peptidoglycan-binding protein LysM [Gammaproteobacteria bacterium]|nr:peptidoglycan-binding protein LysM [Gammaproteobacteria bacterium]NNF62241.1 peptidoglycan-binding protein LysM [Gammaproteobacteria bacterium]NNM21038.1 peptidoglycan-binding protein LysM [Gammaproteobacteria bacterium]
MDLFGFVKDVGRRVFNKDEDAAEKIQELIEANNPGVKNLGVEFDGGIVSLRGHCESGDAHQKVVLMAGNVQGVVDVDASNLTYDKTRPAEESVAKAAERAKEGAAAVLGGNKEQVGEPKVEFYVIQSGDTLSKLAKKYYGDAMQYPKIFEANREIIEDPDKIYVGQKIRIPLD